MKITQKGTAHLFTRELLLFLLLLILSILSVFTQAYVKIMLPEKKMTLSLLVSLTPPIHPTHNYYFRW